MAGNCPNNLGLTYKACLLLAKMCDVVPASNAQVVEVLSDLISWVPDDHEVTDSLHLKAQSSHWCFPDVHGCSGLACPSFEFVVVFDGCDKHVRTFVYMTEVGIEPFPLKSYAHLTFW